MLNLKTIIDRWLYPDFGDSSDEVVYRAAVLRHLTPDTAMLDIGAGRGRKPLLRFQGCCKFVAGVDPDEAVTLNPFLDESRVQQAPLFAIPYEDEAFDVVCAANVVEHVEDIDFFLSEVCRVLKPGGYFVLKTPNRRHYVAMLSRLTPTWFHAAFNSLRGRSHADTFPTTYPCNDRLAISDAALRAGMYLHHCDVFEGRPEYARVFWPTYLVGALYERIVNRFAFLEPLRCVLIADVHKPLDLLRSVRHLDHVASASVPPELAHGGRLACRQVGHQHDGRVE